MRLLRRSALILVCCAVPVLGAAPAHASVTLPTIGITHAIDGDDLYTLDHVYGRSGYVFTAVLKRQSLSGGKRVKVASVRSDIDNPVAISAGGGRVALQFGRNGNRALTTKVVSFDRKGKRRKVLASGSVPHRWNSKGPVRCGTVVTLMGASSTGSFVIAKATYERKHKPCGGKADTDHWRYTEHRPGSATPREIYSVDAPTKGRYKYQAPVAQIDLNGNFAAIVTANTLKIRVRNLETGVLTGPFADSPSTSPLSGFAKRISLAANGALLVNSEHYEDKTLKGTFFTDVFLDPAFPATAVRAEYDRNLVFCGNRLVTFPDIGNPADHRVIELDPATFAEVRTLAAAPDLWEIESCDANRMILVTHTTKGTRLTPVKFP